MPIFITTSSTDLREPMLTANCCICMTDTGTERPDGNIEFLVILLCGHAFGSMCLVRTLQGRSTCPTCKFTVDQRVKETILKMRDNGSIAGRPSTEAAPAPSHEAGSRTAARTNTNITGPSNAEPSDLIFPLAEAQPGLRAGNIHLMSFLVAFSMLYPGSTTQVRRTPRAAWEARWICEHWTHLQISRVAELISMLRRFNSQIWGLDLDHIDNDAFVIFASRLTEGQSLRDECLQLSSLLRSYTI